MFVTKLRLFFSFCVTLIVLSAGSCCDLSNVNSCVLNMSSWIAFKLARFDISELHLALEYLLKKSYHFAVAKIEKRQLW